MRIVVINPGSTSTKLGAFDDQKELFSQKIDHSLDDFKGFATIYDQFDYRMNLIQQTLKEKGIFMDTVDAVVGRGGLTRPIPCGTYLVNDKMVSDLKAGVEGLHASNLGAGLARGLADPYGLPSFIVDPVTTDELEEVARITGLPEIRRVSRLHTLNHKAVARKVAAELGGRYEDMNFVVCHLGTGTSVAAHKRGRAVDMCDARGEGPMSLERCGAVNSFLMMELAFSGKYTQAQLTKMIYSNSGMVAHLGTKDIREVVRMIETGDKHAELILDAMIYQVAKEIGAEAAALSGDVDRIIITGGVAYSEYNTSRLRAKVSFIAPVVICPGEEEMEALAQGALRVLTGMEKAKEYE